MVKSTFIEAAYQAGMIGAKLRIPREENCLNYRDNYLKEAFERGYNEHILKPAFKKGEMMKISHPCGDVVNVVYDDIRVGDNVVLYCSMLGVLAAGTTQPTIVKTYVEKIGENGEEVANTGDDNLVLLNKMARPYHQSRILKLA